MAPRILVDITHPAHFHFFRPAMEKWQQKGYELIIGARAKDVTLQLLDSFGYEYTVLSQVRSGMVGLFVELVEHQIRLWRLIQRERPAVILEVAGTFIVHVAALSGIPALVFYDTEHARLSNAITYPFATKIITPQAYEGNIGHKHIRYNGYQELAYLHPNYFRPNEQVCDELGLEQGEQYFIIRFVSWGASHDRGHNGFTQEGQRALVKMLESYGSVVISSEAGVPPELEEFQYNLSPARMHDALAYATLFIGEGGTMATEAALLGTPSIFVSTLDAGTWHELQNRYGLLYFFKEESAAMNKVQELLSNPNLKTAWQSKRGEMLSEKIDVTEYIVQLVEPFCQEKAAT